MDAGECFWFDLFWGDSRSVSVTQGRVVGEHDWGMTIDEENDVVSDSAFPDVCLFVEGVDVVCSCGGVVFDSGVRFCSELRVFGAEVSATSSDVSSERAQDSEDILGVHASEVAQQPMVEFRGVVWLLRGQKSRCGV